MEAWPQTGGLILISSSVQLKMQGVVGDMLRMRNQAFCALTWGLQEARALRQQPSLAHLAVIFSTALAAVNDYSCCDLVLRAHNVYRISSIMF